MRSKTLLTATICAASLTALSATGALAGEWTGNGGRTAAPEHARSVCSYSGLNLDPGEEADGRTQSYGQLVRAGLKAFIPSPGQACNPNTSFEGE